MVKPASGGTGSTSTAFGVTSGRVLRSSRESLNLSQERLAESLRVDVNTLKAWETGRRPLGNVKAAALHGITRRLRILGADAHVLGQLPTAMDVDATVSAILNDSPNGKVAEHPLATWVIDRTWTRLLTETFSESSKLVAGEDRRRFCANLRRAAEAALLASDDECSFLLRRQVLYVLASISHDHAEWLSQIDNVTAKSLRNAAQWSPAWVACRSLAIARTTTGDPDPLRWFIREYMQSDALEAADLNYWAYWVGGEADRHEALSDRFMADELGPWHGRALLRVT
jgi:transcriptional regulator with XRE-family HTH domain